MGGLGSIALGLLVRGFGNLCTERCSDKTNGPTGVGFFAVGGASIGLGILVLILGVNRHQQWRDWRARVAPPVVQRSAAGTWTVGLRLRF